MQTLKNHRNFIAVLILFAIIYSLISVINHYCFRSYALDLGLYTNALYDYAHLRFDNSTIFRVNPENLLADHFDLYLMIFSPLVYIFGTYTLLIIQIVFMLFGAGGIYTLFKNDRSKALLASIYFLSFFGSIAALVQDYHSNVISAAVLPWFFVFVRDRKHLASFFTLIFCLIGKENFSLFMAFICVGLAIEYHSDKRILLLLATGSILSAFYFITVTQYVMPYLSIHQDFDHLDFTHLGSNISEIITFALLHPLQTIQMLFTNHVGPVHGDFLKLEVWIFLFLGGLPWLIAKPHYLIMLIPLLGQKFLHDNYLVWGASGHYNIEFAPILALGAFTVLKNRRLQIIALCLSIACTIRLLDNPVAIIDKAASRVYQKVHYTQEFDIKQAHNLIDQIPKNAKVSATTSFVPHLALREHIYSFPILKDAEYIVYSETESFYPLTTQEGLSKVLELKQNGFEVWGECKGAWVLKKVH